MRDMIPRGDRSIRNIPVPSSHRKSPPPSNRPSAPDYDEEYEEVPPQRHRRRQRNRGSRNFWLIAFAVVLVCALSGFLLSTAFTGVTVRVYPKTQEITAPESIDARLQAPAGSLSYQTMSILGSATTTAQASGMAHVSRQASGVITIYNAYSTDPQRLIANTRFEAPDHKIYRIRDSITVPGATKQGETLVPGTATATIYADSPGADYNRQDPTRFTIPGFAGDPRFSKFYAQSQGPISGGFVGEEPSVPQEELAKAQANLKLQLDSTLRAKAQSEVPDGFFAVPGTLTITYGDLNKVQQGNSAALSQSAVAMQAIIKASEFASVLARLALGNEYHGEAVALSQSSAITITLATSSKPHDEVLHLKLSGTGILVWQFDPQAVKQAILGKNQEALSGVIQTFAPAITRAEASIRPFWVQNFPTDPEKIQVVVGTQ
jgi:hypothetical protein